MLVGLPGRRPVVAPFAGVVRIGAADQPGQPRSVFSVPRRVGEIDPQIAVKLGRQLQRLQLDRQQVVGLGVELKVMLDFPRHPGRIDRGLRAGDNGEAAGANAGFALRLQLAGAAFPVVQPDAQAMLFSQRDGQRFDAGRVVVAVAEKQVEFARRSKFGQAGRQQ